MCSLGRPAEYQTLLGALVAEQYHRLAQPEEHLVEKYRWNDLAEMPAAHGGNCRLPRKAPIDILQTGGSSAYERALAALRADTRAAWEECLAEDLLMVCNLRRHR